MPKIKRSENELNADWRLRAKTAKEQALPGEHAWFNFKEDQFKSCAFCGSVQRADGQSKPCPGPVKITLR